MSKIVTASMSTRPAAAAIGGLGPRPPVSPQLQVAPRFGAPSAPRFGDLHRLFTVGPNPMDRIRPGTAPSVSELLTVQRAFSEYALKVELCAKSADAVTGVVRRLQQGG